MRRYLKLLFILCFFMFFFICTSYGQEPGCDPLCNCRKDGSICPIDGGLSALLAIGVAYGIKKYNNTKKHPEAPDQSILE